MSALRDGIAAHDWAVQTPRLRALELDFALRSTDGALGRYLAHVLSPFEAEGEPQEWWSVVVPPGRNQRAEIWVGDELCDRRRPGYLTIQYVLWRVNQETIRRSRAKYLLLHASGAVHNGRAVAFPAAMESGKTTLVAGLVRCGLEYLTDEAVAIDPDTLVAHPFPKALSIDPGSWEVLADLRPSLDEESQKFMRAQWHVPVGDIEPGLVAERAPIEHFVFPKYDAGGRTELTAMTRSEAFLAAAENAFNLSQHGRNGFHALAETVRRAECHRLIVSELDRACELVMDLLAR